MSYSSSTVRSLTRALAQGLVQAREGHGRHPPPLLLAPLSPASAASMLAASSASLPEAPHKAPQDTFLLQLIFQCTMRLPSNTVQWYHVHLVRHAVEVQSEALPALVLNIKHHTGMGHRVTVPASIFRAGDMEASCM